MANRKNDYEDAFEMWLVENKVRYVVVDQKKRALFRRSCIKSFDFLIYPPDSPVIVAEVKGRKFRGSSLAKPSGFQSWITMDDIRGLIRWEQVFGKGYQASIVFAYKLEQCDVDSDGRRTYHFQGKEYLFMLISVEKYRQYMTVRSPKWQTVSLPAAKFIQMASDAQSLIY